MFMGKHKKQITRADAREEMTLMCRQVMSASISGCVDMVKLKCELATLEGRDYVQGATGLLRVAASLLDKESDEVQRQRDILDAYAEEVDEMARLPEE